MMESGLIKQIAAVLLVVLSAGVWLYLDYMNKQEQAVALQMRQEVVKIRESEAENRVRSTALAKATFETSLRTEYTNCLTEADKARNEYLVANIKPVPKKSGQFSITQAVLDEAAKVFTTRNADCQLTYNTRLQKGS